MTNKTWHLTSKHALELAAVAVKISVTSLNECTALEKHTCIFYDAVKYIKRPEIFPPPTH